MADLDKLMDAFAGLTSEEAGSLAGLLEDKLGIKGGGPPPIAMPTEQTSEPEAAQTEFDVILKAAGGEKIKVIKEVRGITGLGLKEAKALVDGAPKAVKEAVDQDEANKLKEQLEKVGAEVEIK